MKSSHLVIATLFVSNACIDNFNINVGSTSMALVVDGMITTDPGPYRVRLFWTSTVVPPAGYYGNVSSLPTPVIGAQVSLSDDQGTNEPLKSKSPGIYETDSSGIQGIAGRTYQIKIITPDGQSFSSLPEMITPPGTIDSLYFEFKVAEAIQNGLPEPADGFNIYVNAHGNSLQSILRWSWTGTYKVFTHPELVLASGPDAKCCPPAFKPLACSGYITTDPLGHVLKQIGACTCCICWAQDYQGSPLLSDNQFLSNNIFQHYNVAFIPFLARNFYEKYYLEVRQMTISQNTYQFWKLIQSQQTGSTSLFQPPIAKVRGNIINNSGNNVALGIFSACGMARKSIWIYRKDVPFTFTDPIITDSCTVINPTSTRQEPLFWQ